VPRSPEELVRLKSEYVLPCVKHYYERPMNLVKGSMQFLEDSTGRQYLDFFAGILSVNSGHSNPEINAAVHAQIDRLQHVSTAYLIEPMIELAQELAEITPGSLQKSFFCNSGTEANDTALLTAKLFTGCDDVLALRNSYHGRSHVAIGVSGLSNWRLPVASMGNVHFTANGYCYRCPFGLEYPSCDLRCARDAEGVIQSATSGRIAAFIAEPIQGVGGFVTPPPEYFPIIYEIVKRYGGVTIADEVQGAWGRTGTHMFSIQHWGVQPDIMVFAKGMANWLRHGALIARAEVANAYSGPNISTFGGNPISMVAALTNLRYLARARSRGEFRAHGQAAAGRPGRAAAEAPLDRRGARQGSHDRRRAGARPAHQGARRPPRPCASWSSARTPACSSGEAASTTTCYASRHRSSSTRTTCRPRCGRWTGLWEPSKRRWRPPDGDGGRCDARRSRGQAA
jgi:4-aminobutyrate aminotransferase-like enzyme